ncbi:hypothetical protein [Gemmatimonas aurantiaca]|uniref:hypothetical protein n=1 Tax=Gemmatimonas aurantiaca TaxID=173480 RepID=UPI00301DAE5B
MREAIDSTTLRGTHRTIFRWGSRFLVGAVLLVGLAPIVTIATSRPTRTFDLDRISARLHALDSLRDQRMAFTAPGPGAAVDPSGTLRDSLIVTLRQLGAVQPIFPRRRETASTARPWNALAPDAAMFPGLRSTQYRGPNPSMIIARAREGFTSAEMSYLGVMAQAPLWNDFEGLTRLSPAAGLLLPVDRKENLRGDRPGNGSSVPLPPLLAFGEARQLAIASVYRAAWLLARHDSAGAERALRQALTVGFALIDVGTGAVDALAGAMFVDLTRDGLQQLRAPDSPAAAINRTALTRPRLSFIESMMNQTSGTPLFQLRRELIDAVSDSVLPRVLRLQALQSLVLTTCDEIRTALLGPDAAMLEAAAEARRTLMQVPADRAFFDAIDAAFISGPTPTVPVLAAARPTPVGTTFTSVTNGAIGRAGDLVAWATRTPRIARCTRRALPVR